MKYRIMYIANWIDENILVHGERQPFIWLDIKVNGEDAYFTRESDWINRLQWYRLCEWSALLHEWAAEQCCDVGCVRCS